MVYTAGNKGDSVRSDCWVTIELTKQNGIELKIESKVKKLYGKSIALQCQDLLLYYNIKHAKLNVIDKGALPFVLSSRLEAAIRKATDSNTFYSFSESKERPTSERFAPRFSRLYIPGNSPKLMLNAAIYGSHGVILDLEDSVHPEKKNEARILVRNALNTIEFKGCERMVRINQLPLGLSDLEEIIPQKPNLILVPKCENGMQLQEVDKCISDIVPFKEFPIYIMPIIESALGVQNAFEIAKASERNAALAIGLEDYTADIGVERSKSGQESFYARSCVVNAAKAAGIQAIDSVFSDVGDMEALKENVEHSKDLGFVGMGCIHPRQVNVINKGFAPGIQEVDKAKKIVVAFSKAQEQGLGVVSLGTKMIDPPVVERALNTIKMAINTGELDSNWRTAYED